MTVFFKPLVLFFLLIYSLMCVDISWESCATDGGGRWNVFIVAHFQGFPNVLTTLVLWSFLDGHPVILGERGQPCCTLASVGAGSVQWGRGGCCVENNSFIKTIHNIRFRIVHFSWRYGTILWFWINPSVWNFRLYCFHSLKQQRYVRQHCKLPGRFLSQPPPLQSSLTQDHGCLVTVNLQLGMYKASGWPQL